MLTPLFKIARPLIHAMDAETAHRLTIKALKTLPVDRLCTIKHNDRLSINILGQIFPGPVGIAAGFDKNAEICNPMLGFGFGFVEVGTVTPKPQTGNPRPRVFRSVPHEAVINRMGFPNAGLATFKHNIRQFREKDSAIDGIVGLNIGMNKDQIDPASDYCLLIDSLAQYADYFTVNISSPNTPGLRDLQARDNLMPFLERILKQRSKTTKNSTHIPPILVKLAPDLSDQQIKDLAACALESGIDGLILTNTTLARPDYLPENFRNEAGGLSGEPLCNASTEIIRKFYAETGGKLPIIGVGGISSAQDVYDKMRAGASLVQLYSALVFHGPGIVEDIYKGLLLLLDRDNVNHLQDVIGADHRA